MAANKSIIKERGAAMVEYAFIVALVAFIAVSAVNKVGLEAKAVLYAGGGTMTSMSPQGSTGKPGDEGHCDEDVCAEGGGF